MGMFGVDQAEYDKFKQWSVDRFKQLETKIAATAAGSAEEARLALDVVRERRAEVETLATSLLAASDEIRKARSEVDVAMRTLNESREEYLQDAKGLKLKATKSTTIYEKLEQAEASTQAIVESYQVHLTELNRLLAEAQQIPGSIETLNKLSVDAKAESDNIKSLLSHSLRRKSDLDEVHREILGHDVEDEAGNVAHVDGLREELDKAYEGLSERLDGLQEEVNKTVQKVDADQLEGREQQNREFAGLIDAGRSDLDDVSAQLKALMPGALAAGLSAAYEKKTQEEASSLISHERNFKQAVIGLVMVSVIPFAIDVYLLLQGGTLATVLQETPRLIVSILPLYFPVLWLAYSANKRLNLSKRLIEEYTHKAVLGKTFSGLSNQIETLPAESAIKSELRTRLLFNVLQVSAENPGKLITDYGKSDHPLMDVLEKSARLSESVETLSKIPGLSILAEKLSARSETLLKVQEAKIRDGLAISEEIDRTEPGPG